jgi:hypothetical protein
MPALLATTVMDNAAALLNDQSQQQYTYLIQIPYLNMALSELKEYFELNNVPVTDTFTADAIDVPSGTRSVGFGSAVLGTDLPADFIEPKIVWERQEGVDPYIPMTRVDALPRWQEGVELNQFIWFTWQSQEIRFLPANQNNQLKMDYIRDLFATVTPANYTTFDVAVINAQSFLQYRTAGLAARFVGENPTRAGELDNDAGLSMDRALGIGTKGRQAILLRRRPFRSAYKNRSYT